MSATIDLQRGLEAMYTFDDVDVSAQRNIVRDRSGHGRHAAANGGITTGVESPVGEAASGDGTDDYYKLDTPVETPNAETICGLVKPDKVDGNEYAFMGNFGGGYGDKLSIDPSNQWELFTKDGNGNNVSIDGGSPTAGEYELVFGMWDGSRIYLLTPDELIESTSISNKRTGNNNFEIFAEGYAGSLWPGDIAFVAKWSRVLSWPEIQELNRMTARKVARL